MGVRMVAGQLLSSQSRSSVRKAFKVLMGRSSSALSNNRRF